MAASPNDQEEPLTQINVVPLVDIMMVLLIIFMVTASFISTPSLPVQLPKSMTASPTQPQTQALTLTARGDLYYQGRLIDPKDLSRILKEACGANPQIRVLLCADREVSHGRVVALLDQIREAGVVKVALGVAKP